MSDIRLIMAASLALSFLTTAAVDEATASDRFRLFADCGPMFLIVGGLSEDATKTGLTKESIQAAGESRLRSARLYIGANTAALQYLYIAVNVVGGGFSVGLEFSKWVFDSLSGEELYAVTWGADSTGTHGGDSGFLLSAVSQHLDKFLVEYLRVNEEACGKR